MIKRSQLFLKSRSQKPKTANHLFKKRLISQSMLLLSKKKIALLKSLILFHKNILNKLKILKNKLKKSQLQKCRQFLTKILRSLKKLLKNSKKKDHSILKILKASIKNISAQSLQMIQPSNN